MPWGPDEDKQLVKASNAVGFTTDGKALLGPYWCRTWVPENTPDYLFSWPADNLMVDLSGLSIAHFRGLVSHPEVPSGSIYECLANNITSWPDGPVVQVDPWDWPGEEQGWTYIRFNNNPGETHWYLEVQVSTYGRNGGTTFPTLGGCYALYVYVTTTGERSPEWYHGQCGFVWAGLKSGDTPYGTYRVACTHYTIPVYITDVCQTPGWIAWQNDFGGGDPYGQALPCGQDCCSNLEFTVSAV